MGGAGRICNLHFLPPFGHGISPSGEVWDACAAHGLCLGGGFFLIFAALRAWRFAVRRSLGRLRGARQGGAGYGAAPPARPPLHPPRSTPKRAYNFLKPARATRLLLRELPSLAPLSQVISLRAALCQIQLSLWILFRFSQILTETCSLKKCLCIVPAPKNSP